MTKHFKDYIELVYETGWKKPVQVYSHCEFFGEKHTRHWFSEFDTFREAIEIIKENHNEPIVINKQMQIGI